MRYARVEAEGREFLALVEGDELVELGGSLFGLHVRTRIRHPLSAVTFLPPIMPGTFYAAGFNYRAHNRRHEDLGFDAIKVGPHPEVGYRAPSALVGHGAAIVKPADVEGRFETEAEVVAVIGRTLKHASRDEAMEAVLGWTIGNDVSARAWQHSDRTFWRAKNADTFKPMGPWIETDVDPLQSITTVRRNGVVDATFATGDMIFDPYDFIVEMTKYITIHPGDVLWMGADGSTAMDVGDTIDIEISGIGTLTNAVVGEVDGALTAAGAGVGTHTGTAQP